jgi:hypothetical protein
MDISDIADTVSSDVMPCSRVDLYRVWQEFSASISGEKTVGVG